MKEQQIFTTITEKHGNEYISYIKEVPGANGQGTTLAEAETNLQEALKLLMEVRREIGQEYI